MFFLNEIPTWFCKGRHRLLPGFVSFALEEFEVIAESRVQET